MRLTNANFDYCKRVGMLKENFTREHALKELREDMAETKDMDPAFLAEFEKVTVNSSNAGTWVAVMYNYDIDVTYKIQGKTLSKNISDFGKSGTPDALHVTEYYGDGEFKTLTDVATECKFPVWNDNNIFSFDEMKGALKTIIENDLPSGWKSYEANDWTVSAYLVPIFSIDITVNGKEYTINYNLHNGHWNYDYLINKAILKKAKSVPRTAKALSIVGLILAAFFTVVALATQKGALTAVPAVALVYNIVMLIVYKKKDYKYCKNYFCDHPDAKPAKLLIPVFVGLGLAVVSFFFLFA